MTCSFSLKEKELPEEFRLSPDQLEKVVAIFPDDNCLLKTEQAELPISLFLINDELVWLVQADYDMAERLSREGNTVVFVPYFKERAIAERLLDRQILLLKV